MNIRVLLVDDDELVRAGLRMIVDSQPDLEVVGEAGDGEAAVALAAELAPDVVLMDIRMPSLDGLEATRRIAATGAEVRVLVLTTFEIDEYVFDAVRAGASGFLLKRTPPDDLLAGIRTLAAGDGLLGPSVTARLMREFARVTDEGARETGATSAELSELTAREREVLVLMARGRTNQEIGGDLYISESTVKTHVKRILMKLGLRDRVHAVVFAYQCGLLQPSTANPSAPDGS
ncbi:response regulator transcription factor [Svornostia abyssi]|uniref:Response regulator transcription factor n=1 Tax=Svornostia abyssi TaxID=2898438 RepID=A0ABY5PMH7_9ACTN|nr:response regulator transcription factor [Parviterribacteraceae bacterium J379]